jgi:acyl carrier protein
MSDFITELTNKLIENLGLEEVDTDAINKDTFLFGDDGFELDSIDAIEIEVMIKTEYGIDIKPSERNRSTFGTLGTLADFVEKNRDRDT